MCPRMRWRNQRNRKRKNKRGGVCVYVTFNEYQALGYNAVTDANDFSRYELPAEQVVRRYTQNRISDVDLHPPDSADAETKRVAELNQRGVCEMVDALYANENPSSDFAKKRTPIIGFSNAKYSETYALRTQGSAETTLEQEQTAIMGMYFTDDQLWRGLDNAWC